MQSRKLSITANDGAAINTRAFDPAGDPKGVLIICHGFGEHLAMYREVAAYFTGAGYACVIFDQRGHGEFCDKKSFGIIPGYASFLDDIDAVRKEVSIRFSGVPLILFGHSMGGNIAVNYLLDRNQEAFAAAVLETPWLRLYKPIPSPIVGLARWLGGISPKFAIINKLKIQDISRDREQNAAFADDALYHNRISFRMFAGVNDAGEHAIANAANIRIPVFLACAEGDKIVSPQATKEFADRANANVSLKVYPDAYHSVHSDIIKEDYFTDVREFLSAVI